MFRQISTSASPNIIGVTNGLYQIEIDEKSIRKNANYKEIEELINEIDVNQFLAGQNQIFQLKIKHLKGRFLEKAKKTDVMGFSPFIFGFKYIVSQKFVDCLIDEMVEENEFHIFKIDIGDSNMDHYLLFVPMIPNSAINFSESLLFPEKDLLVENKQYFNVNNYEQYIELIKSNVFIRWEKIILSKEYENKSIINLQGNSELFFSDSLIERLLSQDITNMLVKDNIKLMTI